jgi:hypothetical protein
MPKGIPTTIDGWVRRLKNLPMHNGRPETELRALAYESMRKHGILPAPPPTIVTFDGLFEDDPALANEFQRLWQAIADDARGLPAVKTELAQQTAVALLLMRRGMIGKWLDPEASSTDLDRLSLVMVRFVEHLQQSPKTRGPEKSPDEGTISDLLAAAERARDLAARAEELAMQDKALMEAALLEDPDIGERPR